ncbi:hypothetical protein V5F49_10245 [Xanthobacter sp. V3C-3]|uniref:hypothetical protein n=1 Tax=Xanthobacter lutulentifluminis TaxID=3119935 RepID=UPI00372B7F16
MLSPARPRGTLAAEDTGTAKVPAPRGRRLGRILSPVAANLARFLPAASRTEAEASRPAFPAPPRPARSRLTRLDVAILSFAVGVVLPSVATLIYLTAFAAPQFKSETRFVVRGNLETVAGGSSPVSAGGVPQVPNTQEARVVVDFLRSRAMVDALQEQLDLRRVFGISASDPVFGLSPTAGVDDMVAYWNRQVKVSLETLSGVIRVQVHAFSPQSAAMVAAAVVREAEAVTNELTNRNRGDRVLQAEAEERAAFTELAAARSALEEFRNAQGTLDPTRTALDSFGMIAKLRDQRSSLNTDISVARARLDEDSPVVRALRERMRSLDEKIGALDAELLGAGQAAAGTSANLKAAAEMEVRRRLAEQRLRQAEAELLDARAQQGQKQVYILTFMAPTLPMETDFPSPLTGTAAVAGILFAFWAVVTLYVGSVYARTR